MPHGIHVKGFKSILYPLPVFKLNTFGVDIVCVIFRLKKKRYPSFSNVLSQARPGVIYPKVTELAIKCPDTNSAAVNVGPTL